MTLKLSADEICGVDPQLAIQVLEMQPIIMSIVSQQLLRKGWYNRRCTSGGVIMQNLKPQEKRM